MFPSKGKVDKARDEQFDKPGSYVECREENLILPLGIEGEYHE